MSDLFGIRSMGEVVQYCLENLGSRASLDDLVSAVEHTLTLAEHEDWRNKAFRQAVNSIAKRKPADPLDHVYSTGEDLAPLRLFSVEEFTNKARELASLSRANRNKVFFLAKVCEEIHHQTFDAEAICAEAGI